jgi:hypothetical protein
MRKVDDPPKTQGVYALEENNEVIYIGKACDMKRRLSQHAMTNSKECNVYIHETEQADSLEGFLLRIFIPKYNSDIPTSQIKEAEVPDGAKDFVEKLPLPQYKRSFWVLKENDLIEENFWKEYKKSEKTVNTISAEATA